MKTIRLIGTVLFPALLACGCSTMSNTDTGVAAGGLLGAGTGAALGAASGHPGAGALIGAGVGAVSGGLIGAAADESERKKEAQIAASTARQLGIVDVAQLTKSQVADSVIIAQIRSTGSVFRLSSNDTIWLKQNGVSDPVIQEMLASATRYPPHYYYGGPVYAEPVYVEPPPIGIGFGFGGRFR
jgi:outer membrane lipoprotein SlyB